LIFILGDPDTLVIENYGAGSETLDDGFQQNCVQIATMNGNLGPSVTRVPAARLGIHQLARTGVKQIFAGRDASRDQPALEPQVRQLADGMRQQVQADTKCTQLRSRLIDPHGSAVAVQRKSQREPTDSRANDDNIVLVTIRHG
jgi:hypothetical protein